MAAPLPRAWTRDEFTISTDPARLDLDAVKDLLDRSYWAAGRSRDRIALSVEHSLPFGVYHGATQVGFCRVVTDYVAVAWLADVVIHESYRGKGLGRWLVDVVTNVPELRSVRRWLLGTRDAHELYRKVGFRDLPPGIFMERVNPDSDAQS